MGGASDNFVFFMRRSRDRWKIVSTSKVPSAHASGEKGLSFRIFGAGPETKKKKNIKIVISSLVFFFNSYLPTFLSFIA